MKHLIFILLSLFATLQAQAQLLPEAQRPQNPVDDDIRKLIMATVMTNNFYVDTVNTSRLVEDAIRGMLSALDPHSSYTSPKETQAFNEPLQGSFEGIGVQFNILDDTLLVLQTVAGGPSERVGILAGDRIITVDTTTIAGVSMSRENIMKRLRGPKGTIAHLGIRRPGIEGLCYFDVHRDKIPVTTVDAAYMATPTIGLIRFSSFGQTTHDEVVEAIERLRARGMKDLILDLTQNGGGYLNAAADIASEFLPEGDLIVYTRGRNVPPQTFKSSGGRAFQKGRVVVLVDEYSASAAEILAGAIQDQDRGTVIGRRSFGKGLVQRPIELSDGSMIRLTVAHYYTPSGRCIQKPYVKGKKEDYNKDVLQRLQRGELTNRDSIHLNDSLAYKTLRRGRTVYGGGGMPDVFVPLDTTVYTRYYRELSARSVILNANLHYLDQYRKELRALYKTFDRYAEYFTVPDTLLRQVEAEGEKLKIKPRDEEERRQTLPEVARTLKALIARDLWDMSEYFNIIYQHNAMVQRAIEELK